ncbi:MAG: hypothetical protein CMI18_02710 [Opitutaceae bacterium]|nr:hypothetical protein [Opitutaceae bacterium]|tara:strand:- start:7731 stop:8216 length:486 start_codon:yes stop_codon:yes gene_type:complete
MDWRSLNRSKEQSEIRFYLMALQYAQVLWLKGLPSRALLAVDRALLINLAGHETELQEWPLPYKAMAWMLKNYDEDQFVGNPRVHFQHLASRIRGHRKEQRKWRAWACWFLACRLRPDLPRDEKQSLVEPSKKEITQGLATHGIDGEDKLWEKVADELSET